MFRKILSRCVGFESVIFNKVVMETWIGNIILIMSLHVEFELNNCVCTYLKCDSPLNVIVCFIHADISYVC